MLPSIALILNLLVGTADSTARPTIQRCDDGAPAWKRDGRPNYQCRLDGCAPSDAICRPESVCEEEEGGEECPAPVSCNSTLGCFADWLTCTKKWICSKPTWYGACERGQCG